MRVRVLFFGMLKDVTGKSADVIDLPPNATVADLLAQYGNAVPKLHAFVPALAISVNREYARPEASLHDDDEVALLPPVSGGSGPQRLPARATLVRDRIDSGAIIESLKHATDGAVVVFDGIVRDNSRGRRTLFLDYEAYEAMALAELQKLAAEALTRFAIRDCCIVHRLGRLEIGESSVLIVIAAAHRAAAFDACRWIIDTLKKTVPIWKKEHFADGAVWADGEPFPSHIAAGPEDAQ